MDIPRRLDSAAAQLEDFHTHSPYSSIRTAWDRGIDLIKPTSAQVQRGLELHLASISLDHFGFIPQIFTPELATAWRALKEANIGARDFHFELSILRFRAGVETSHGLEEFLYALAASGLTGLVQTCAEGKTHDEDIKRIASFHGICQKTGTQVTLAGDVNDIQNAHREGRFGIIPSVNGPPCTGHHLDPRDEFQWLQTWHDLGIRLMHLTYNRRTAIGDGCAEPGKGGLSDLGGELISCMNKLGIIVDIPHCGDQTSLDACKSSSKPVMASHTGRRAFHDHMRNKSDEVLKAIAGTDGLVGIVSLPSILGGRGDLSTLLDAVEDLAHLIGVDHISIATDYAYKSETPEAFRHGALPNAEFKPAWWGNTKPGTFNASSTEHFGGSLQWTNWPLFTVGLVNRGFSDEAIAKILGGNFLRVLKANTPPLCARN